MTAKSRYLALALVLAAVYLWVGTRPRMPRVLQLVPDWAGHGTAYAVLGGVLDRGLFPAPAPLAVASATAHGVLLEWLQKSVPGRSAQATDVLADAVGALLGVGLCRRQR